MEPNFLSVLALSSLSLLTGSLQQPSLVGSYELPAIAGVWQMANDGQNACQASYHFGRDNYLTIVDNKQRTLGEYRFIYVTQDSLPVIAVQPLHSMTQDNNTQDSGTQDNTQDNAIPADCLSTQVYTQISTNSQDSQSFAVYAKLDARHNPKKMSWCSDEAGLNCPIELWRKLP